MATIKTGDRVRLHYKGTLTDGTVFDDSTGREPLSFVQGAGSIIPGLDKALPGMAVGEKKRVEVDCAEGYGPRQDAGVTAVEKSLFPDDMTLEEGMRLQMQTQTGQAVPVTVVEVGESEVTLDANHALAGQDLVFDIEVVGIEAA